VRDDRLGLRSADWQAHIRNKPRREALAKRFKDPNDPFKMVIVRDMWLTGFDAPCLHTMYVDKPMRGHGLMQAIARVNRVFRDKPGGLVVDYLGLADQLKYAAWRLHRERRHGPDGHRPGRGGRHVMLEKYEVCCGIFHGFDWTQWKTGGPQERFGLLPAAQEHILAQDDGKNRLVKAVRRACPRPSLAVPHDEGAGDSGRRGLLPGCAGRFSPRAPGEGHRSPEEIELAIAADRVAAVSSER
jgi:type I restriction enzyme R subunit